MQTIADKARAVMAVAETVVKSRPTWVVFFREILDTGGVVRQMFGTPESLAQFEKSAEYGLLQKMLAELRAADDDLNRRAREGQRVITVRMPRNLHESLRAEAHDRRTSINKLCIAKLLQTIDAKLVPADPGVARRALAPSEPSHPYKGPAK